MYFGVRGAAAQRRSVKTWARRLRSSTTKSASRQLRTAIIYHWIAHYRGPVMRELCQSEQLECVVFSDVETNEPALPSFSAEDFGVAGKWREIAWKRIKNIWLPKGILWQRGVMGISGRPGFDCVIFLGNAYYLSTWLGAIVARITRKRVLFWTHGLIRDESDIRSFIRVLFYHLSDGLLLYGKRAKQMLMDRGFSRENLYVIYNSLDYHEQVALRETMTDEKCVSLRRVCFSQPELPMVVSVGRLTAVKKIELLIDAAEVLRHRGVEINVLVVGDGPMRADLESRTASRQMTERVVFMGDVYEEGEVALAMVAADVCVVPGAIGLTAIHAMTYGTPVITHDNPDRQMPEYEAIVPGVSGEVFMEGDVEDLATKIEVCLRGRRDGRYQRSVCWDIIDKYYNPRFQRMVIEMAVGGVAASDAERGGEAACAH